MKKIFSSIIISICIVLSFCLGCNNQNVVVAGIFNPFNFGKKEPVVVEKEEIKKEESFNITNINGYRDKNNSTYVEIEFDKDIDDKFEITPYIKINPNINFTASKVNNKIIVNADFNTSTKYLLTVLKNIKAFDGTLLKNDLSEFIQFDQKQPRVVFSNDGIILPSVNDKKVYIRTINVKRVKVDVRKVFVNNTTQFLQNFDFEGNGKYKGSFVEIKERENSYDDEYYYYDDYYDNASNFNNVGELVHTGEYKIENEIDVWVQTAIDLSNIIKDNGIYMVNVSFSEKDSSYKWSADTRNYKISNYLSNNGRINKTILITDIGIIASKVNDGYHVNVLNILNNKPIIGATCYLMSRNNQILEEGHTNSNGIVEFSDAKNPFYVLVEDRNTRSILRLNNALSTNGFSVDGAYASDGINGFIYTERGVYRPGDTIYVSIIARNNKEALLDNQPVKINVYDPTGTKMIENKVITDGKNGFYTYNFKTDVTSRTGIWKLEATIGSEVFKKDISVETVVPNGIKVNIETKDTIDIKKENAEVVVKSNYLFGEPTKGLKYSVSYDVKEAPIDFEKYKDYTFKTNSSFDWQSVKTDKGTLDDKGEAKSNPDFTKLEFGSVNLIAIVDARVEDDGGRTVSTRKDIKLKKYDTYVGIENTSSYKKTGSKFDIKAICVSEDGENLVPNKKLKYKIYGNDRYWWWDYNSYNSFVRQFKSDKNTKLLKEGTLITRDVPVLIEDIVPDIDYIYIELIDESTGQVTSTNLYSSEWVDPSITKRVETLNVRVDKKLYNVGEKAKVQFKGAKNSKAIITIEKAGKIINQYYKDVNDGEITEEISLTKEMVPNVYAYITLLQDYNTKDNDRPMRLYGVVPINVEDDDTKIDLVINSPDAIRPNEDFNVKIKNKNNKQFDYTIAVVDEGLLDITNFETPSPWKHFFKKLAAKLKIYDNYSEIIDKPYGAINQILKVGGDEALLNDMARRRRLKELGLEDADRFVPVSMFKGVLTSDENGEAEVSFTMPNYMGSVRIMVIAASGNSYGSAEKNMLVKAPIIMYPTLPRKMKVGDKMNIPVSIFALEEGIGNIEVYYTFNGKTQTKNLNLNKGDKEIVYFEEVAPNEVKKEKLTVGVKSQVYNYEETVGMAINSDKPAIIVNENNEIKPREELVINQDKEFVKGTVDSVLTLSNTMMLGLDNRLDYLIKYPYGCVEQTSSSLFPQLFIDKVSTVDEKKKKEIIDNVNAGIDRLKLFQKSDGSFSYWPGGSDTYEWATNYVGHLLIYAKKYGYYVPDYMYNNLLKYIDKTVRNFRIDNEKDVDRKCYSLYLLALANKANISEMNYMYENYFGSISMNNTSTMYLAAAYKLAGEEKLAKDIVKNINVKSIEEMYDRLIKKDKYYYNYSYGSKLREVAIYLDCYITIFNTFDKNAYDYILNSLRSKNWYSTQTTSYSLLSLSNVAKNFSEKQISGTIELDDKVVEFSTNDNYKIEIDEDVKNIKIKSNVNNSIFVNYYWNGVLIHQDEKSYSDGFKISRKFYDNEGRDIDYKNVHSGDTFWLEVTVNATSDSVGRVENIALTQILPTGWEIENLRVSGGSTPMWIQDKSKDTRIDYTDIRDDRVMWFFDYNKNKDYKFFVKINAVTKGEYEFPGTTLEAMYDNNYKAYLVGGKVKVE